MSQKLNLQALKNDAKKYDQKTKVQLNDDFHVFINKHFAPSKVQEMLVELFSDFDQAKKEKLDLESIGYDGWLFFLIIKKFSDLNISPILKNKINTYLQIRDSDIYPLLMAAFPAESYERVTRMMLLMQETMAELKKIDEGKLSEIAQKVADLEEAAPQKES